MKNPRWIAPADVLVIVFSKMTPRTATVWPAPLPVAGANVERWVLPSAVSATAPWTSPIVRITSGGVVVNDQTKSAAIWSGGSVVSTSEMSAACTVAVQISPSPRSVAGSRV